MEPKKIYLSGKITGDDNYAETFENKAAELTEQGALVFNPAVHPNMFTHGQFMELDLLALSFCNSIYMMKNWRDSKGAKMEFEEAKVLGLPIEFEEPLYAVSKVVDGETLYYSSVSKDFTTASAQDITSDDLFISEEEVQNALFLTSEKFKEVHVENAEDVFCDRNENYKKDLSVTKEQPVITQTQNESSLNKDVSELTDALKSALKEVAEPLKEIEFSRENYNALFPYSKVESPIETVKLGDHQFEKLEARHRKFILNAAHGTLHSPDLIINETKKNAFGEDEDSHIYAKSYLFDDKVHGIQSVVVSIDDENVSISSHIREINNIVNKIKKPDQLLFAAAKVRLLVERTTGKKLVTVNPTRESEYVKSLDSNIPQNEFFVNKDSSSGVKYSKNIPHKTAIGYKVFYLKDGKLYPPMVQNPGGSDTPVGVWIDASAGDIAGYSKTGRPQIAKGGEGTHTSDGLLAYRPGWHLGSLPIARQFEKTNPENGIKELFPREFVWAECEYACDVDYQKEAMQEGMTENGAFRHSYAGLKHLPENGSYRYRTNPDPNTEEWIITGAIKVKRILSNKEVDEICRKNGRQPQKRERSYEELNDIFRKYFSEKKQKNPYIRFETDKETLMKTLESKGTFNSSESKALISWLKNEKHIVSDKDYEIFSKECQQKEENISKSAKIVKNLEEGLSR